MTTYNTIILLSNKASLTRSEWKKFEEGDIILGIDVNPTELKRWNIEQEAEAKAEEEKLKFKARAAEERLEMLSKMIDNGAEKEFILKVGYCEEEYDRVIKRMNK